MGNAHAIRASRALRPVNVRKMCTRAIALARRFSITLAIISAVISYAGILFDAEFITYSAATIALGSLCLADSTQKGGEE